MKTLEVLLTIINILILLSQSVVPSDSTRALSNASANTGTNASEQPTKTQPVPARTASSLCIYSDFGSVAGLTLNGDAAQSTDKLRLTPVIADQTGAAWCNNKQFIQDGFETTFQFQITDLVSGGADGFAFVIQNNNLAALGDAGENIGYTGIVNSLAVEFDTWYDAEFDDPSNNHISVHTAGTNANSAHHDHSLGSTSAIPDMSDGQVHTTAIQYTSGAMQIFMDDLVTPVLTISVDLPTLLSLDNGAAWGGFTAATSNSSQNHDILNWKFHHPLTHDIHLPLISHDYPRIWDQYCEENDLLEQACPLNFDQTYSAYPNDLDDWYYVFLNQTASLYVLVTNYSAEGQLLVYDSERNLLGQDGRQLPTMEIPNTLDPNALKNLPPGRYYIRVYSSGGTNSDQLYQLTVTKQ